MGKEERLIILLYNAFTCLADETFEQYDNTEDWLDMIKDKIGCTNDEMEEYGGFIFDEDGKLVW